MQVSYRFEEPTFFLHKKRSAEAADAQACVILDLDELYVLNGKDRNGIETFDDKQQILNVHKHQLQLRSQFADNNRSCSPMMQVVLQFFRSCTFGTAGLGNDLTPMNSPWPRLIQLPTYGCLVLY
ncbi:GH17184 [Drosophila grimshawi]|uniref:GH17184 n=1 Tax=Drosophila grimshawi TaxID=7222 RepID=B4J1C4_DROGR|nr:GH17184 [Drosophila grimshawi]